jgi:hypothetical protein
LNCVIYVYTGGDGCSDAGELDDAAAAAVLSWISKHAGAAGSAALTGGTDSLYRCFNVDRFGCDVYDARAASGGGTAGADKRRV